MESLSPASSSSSLLSSSPLKKQHPSSPPLLLVLPLPLAPRRPLFVAAAALKSPRGFGPQKSTKKKDKRRRPNQTADEDEEEEEEEEEKDVAIPEVVTNRMMRRMGLSVGLPVAVGVGFFPLFYYLKVVAKVDVPTWIPFGVSFFFFGAALLGVSYGIVSASWDPLREGSLLGWNEARRNWPVFWESLWGRRIRK